MGRRDLSISSAKAGQLTALGGGSWLGHTARLTVLALGLTAPARSDAQQPPPEPAPMVNLGLPNAAPGLGGTAGDPGAGSDAEGQSATALAEKLQNPIGNLNSVPFQNNANFNVGPNKGTQDILNIQPVIPFRVTPDWNVITRTILPLVWSPSFQPAPSVPFGVGPTLFSAFLSPARPVNGWVWGVGPVVQLPTITSKTLGSNVWGAGPAFVVVKLASPWVYGALINNVFSFGGTSGPGGTKYSVFTINPFVNYNFGGGWFVGTVPLITANWLSSGQKWTLPVGGQFGRLIKVAGKLPVNLLAGVYYNALRPRFGGNWQFRTQVAVVF